MLKIFRYSKRLSLLIFALSLGACSTTGGIGGVPSSSTGNSLSPILILAAPNATATATPFRPLDPTPTYLPTSFPTPTLEPSPTPEGPTYVEGRAKTWADYAGPTVWPDISIPPPTGILSQPEDQVNILLLGSDQRPNTGGFRTDTIILLTLSADLGTANLTSFPRDLYVYIPGWTINRINTAFGFGGFESLATTLEYNFGVRPDYYVLINFWSFDEAVDNLGGLDVEISKPLCDHRDNYGYYCVSESVEHMDGETALWYVRSRYSTSDFDRGRRQQEVVSAGFKKLLSINGITRAPELFEIYQQSVTTDVSLDMVTSLLPLAARLGDNGQINHYFIGPQQVYDYVNYSGAFVLVPIREAVMEVMRQALNSPE
jgi:polyisoprenyl-teichoic acid--peptidoglycan teichoic acid transferase